MFMFISTFKYTLVLNIRFYIKIGIGGFIVLTITINNKVYI